MLAVKIRNLVKRFSRCTVINNINLDIDEGEIFGLLGPNGAGKSTTINCICGLLKYEQGEIIIDGILFKDAAPEVKKQLGLVPQEIAVFDTLTARENLEFFGKLAGLQGRLLKERVAEALEFVNLTERSKDVPKTFSGGMKRRLNIACAIMHHPKLIIMDEPTVGIDTQSRSHILESIRKLNHMGSTILYTSHYMEEIETICSRIAIIDHGKLIACGTPEELKETVSEEERIIIDVTGMNNTVLQKLEAMKEINEVTLNQDKLEIFTSQSQGILEGVLALLRKNNVQIQRINMLKPDLETVFLSLTGRKLRD